VNTRAVESILRSRVRNAGSSPLLTYYDVAQPSRTELSAVTFVNWVSKTANLIEDLDAEPGDVIWLPVLSTSPGHWVGAVWTIAAWLAGTTVSLTDADRSAIGVSGPEGIPAGYGRPSVACSLHPLGLGFAGRVPADLDYADVLAQPDDYVAGRDAAEDLARPAWDAPLVSLGDLTGAAPRDDRFVLLPDDPQDVVVDGVWRCLLGSGSVVVIRGGTAADVQRIALAEHARA
jgi:uncharacterized protein (TIGR03089 family)